MNLFMELIMINQTKLKIMLTPPDMAHYALFPDRLEDIGCNDPTTRAAFRHIFEDAEAQTGFHTSGERLLVQTFTSKCGGCEIFLTKLSAEESMSTPTDSRLTAGETALLRRVLADEEDEDEILWEGGDHLLQSHENRHTSSEQAVDFRHHDAPLRRVILTVDSFSTLLSVCRRLYLMGYEEKSHVYIEEGRTPCVYHLHLEVPDGIFYQLPEQYAFLKEYGIVSRNKYTALYLFEHGRLFRENDAVAVLGRLA